MVSDAMKRLRREQKMRTDEAFAEREARRLQEVKAAFYEGMAAGQDRLWMERPEDDYWLESDARQNLYAGPPLPLDPMVRLKAGRGLPRYPYDPQRDPGRVIGKSFSLSGKRRRKRR